jgi:hypothetical protein
MAAIVALNSTTPPKQSSAIPVKQLNIIQESNGISMANIISIGEK